VLIVVVYALAAYPTGRPFFLLWLISATALASLWHNRQDKRLRLWILTIAFILFTTYCLPITSYLLCSALESRHAPLARRPSDVEGIVVLAGGLWGPQTEGQPFELPDNVRFRCLTAAAMYRQGTRCPVLVSGGIFDPNGGEPACASVMKRVLVEQGVAAEDIIEEPSSRSTHENAVECARLLRSRDLHKVLLVTDGLHLERAKLCFQKAGISVVGCGCNYRTLELERTARIFIPGPSAALGTRAALQEWGGLAWYGLRGWI
jgi:uncharacterized SAM-binding protein YcdF (DUF218 family)